MVTGSDSRLKGKLFTRIYSPSLRYPTLGVLLITTTDTQLTTSINKVAKTTGKLNGRRIRMKKMIEKMTGR